MLRNLFRTQQVETQLDDEIRGHVEMLMDERVAAGMSPSEARRSVLRDVGGTEQLKQSVRDRRAGVGLEMVWRDAHYAARQLYRNPGFTVTMIVTLALSIGANTAIFSFVNALMLNDLPYSQPERIGTIYTRVTGAHPYDERHKLNGEQWELLRDNVPSLISAVSSSRSSGVNLQTGTHVKYLHAGRISAHYLDVLRVGPVMGRNFLEAEDRPQGPHVAILGYHLWQNTFSSDPNVVGRSILLKGEPYTVVGVLADDAVTPLNADLYTSVQASRKGEGVGTNFEVITRLRDGATWQQADAEINHAWSLRTQRYELEDDPGAQASWYSVPLQKGETAQLRPQVLILMLAAGLILLIACANLAGLSLVRTLRRAPEIATRMALGASQWQIQKQLWVESLLLATIGGAAGIAAGLGAVRGLLLLLPEHFLPVAHVALDTRVLMFTLLISLLTTVLFGMLPAVMARKFDVRATLASRTVTGSDRLGVRQALIVGEVALTVVLLAASGLLIRTLIHLETLPPGFNPAGVMTAKASLDDVRYRQPAAFLKLINQSIAAMQQIPGVEHVAVGLSLPYERSLIMAGLPISDGKEAGQKAAADETYVTPGYFETLQIPIMTGRYFTDADGPDTLPVCIVNETFARKFFHGANPLGRHLFKDTMIVGVVKDVAMAPGIDPIAPLTGEQTIYIPASQVAPSLLSAVHIWFQPSWIVRTAAPVEGLIAQMQRQLASVDPNLPFSGFYSMHDLQAKTLATQRVEVALLTTLAGLALLLSSIGIFALVANMVTQKTREIGIRIALGSSIQRAMLDIGTPGVRACIVGLVLGQIFCAGALRAMRSALYGVGVYDLPTMIFVILTFASVVLVATVTPTLRIAGIDPAMTLRDE
jgi:predicted permease